MSAVNADQEAFWSDLAGPVWVRRMQAMDAALGPVLDLVMSEAALRPGERVLDIGCGAGTSTIRAAQAVGTDGHALGADISASLLQLAQDRTQQDTNASFLLADAQTHPFDEASYDLLMSRFGVMFFEDTLAAFGNMARALRPNGRLVFAAWGPIPDNPYFTMPAAVVKQTFGPTPKSDPDGPGPFAFRNVKKVSGLVTSAGLSDVAARTLAVSLTPAGTAADIADLLCDIGPAQVAISHFEMGEAEKDRLKAALVHGLKPFETQEGIRIPAAINIFTARKPA